MEEVGVTGGGASRGRFSQPSRAFSAAARLLSADLAPHPNFAFHQQNIDVTFHNCHAIQETHLPPEGS